MPNIDKVLGVSAANINKVINVAEADIDQVIGYDLVTFANTKSLEQRCRSASTSLWLPTSFRTTQVRFLAGSRLPTQTHQPSSSTASTMPLRQAVVESNCSTSTLAAATFLLSTGRSGMR